jgi:hypothetical protein
VTSARTVVVALPFGLTAVLHLREQPPRPPAVPPDVPDAPPWLDDYTPPPSSDYTPPPDPLPYDDGRPW